MDGEIILPKSPEMVTRSCVEIPIELLKERLLGFESGFERDLRDEDSSVTASSTVNSG
ncbi:MAG: hypothetical protein HC874_17585 [Richelia sp. SL_2_1]|nr:hypothetical protein [Richelia sp. SM1_7_0]NJO29156.1 hypothetical protein [Richelia sp. SL_2_1]